MVHLKFIKGLTMENAVRAVSGSIGSTSSGGIFHEDLRTRMEVRLSPHTATPQEAVRVVEDTLVAYLAAALAGGLVMLGSKLAEKIRSR